MQRGLALLAVLVASLMVATGSATAGGGAPKIGSQVHMHGVGPDPTYDHWVGDVHSRKRKCERRRIVTVFYEETPSPESVGSDTTDRQGHWQVPVAVLGKDDPYYAVVSRKVIGRGDNKVVCKADQSPDFRFIL